jgi:hypothetical protein
MEEAARDQISRLPFRTLFLDWSDSVSVDGSVEDLSEEELEEVFNRVKLGVRDLMLTLRGPNAG